MSKPTMTTFHLFHKKRDHSRVLLTSHMNVACQRERRLKNKVDRLSAEPTVQHVLLTIGLRMVLLTGPCSLLSGLLTIVNQSTMPSVLRLWSCKTVTFIDISLRSRLLTKAV